MQRAESTTGCKDGGSARPLSIDSFRTVFTAVSVRAVVARVEHHDQNADTHIEIEKIHGVALAGFQGLAGLRISIWTLPLPTATTPD